jgi:hypothetical protein
MGCARVGDAEFRPYTDSVQSPDHHFIYQLILAT